MKGRTLFFQNHLQKLVLVGIIIGIMVLLTILSPTFLTTQNFTNVLLKVAVIIIIGSAANLLMLTTNFDLSVGSILAFSGIFFASLSKHGVSLPIALIATIFMASLWGAVNGFTVGKLKIVPVIATLGTQYAARGFAFLIARWEGGSNISSGLPDNFSNFGRAMLFGKVPMALIYMILVVLIFLFIEKKTVLGRYAYAIGDNKQAAELSGINVVGVLFLLYVIIGGLTGFCGAMQVSRVGLAAANIGIGLEFDVLIAIVLGGTSMLGGEGSVINMIFGALIVGLAQNGLNLTGVPFFYQQIVQGLLLIIAVFIDQYLRHRSR